MGFELNPFKKEKTLEELDEDDQKISREYSIAQKKAAIAALKKRGVSPSSFTSLGSIIKWLKVH